MQLKRYAEICGWTLARAHAKSGDAATISGYLGKGDNFDQAMRTFALAYADQTERDHAALVKAVRSGGWRLSARSSQHRVNLGARPLCLVRARAAATPTLADISVGVRLPVLAGSRARQSKE